VDNPWIFSRRAREEIAPGEVQELVVEHLERSLSFYGREEGLVLFRKFAAAYLKPYQLEAELRKKLLTEVDPKHFITSVKEVFIDILAG
jgi:tRNA-dihydrouridine synthase